MMIDEIKNIKSEPGEFRKFGITVGIILILLSGIFLWKEIYSYQILLSVGVVLCVLGFTVPVVLKPIYWIWMIFGNILGWFMTRAILSLLYYIIITAIGLVSRLFGKSFLELKSDYSKRSYWNMRENQSLSNSKDEQQF